MQAGHNYNLNMSIADSYNLLLLWFLKSNGDVEVTCTGLMSWEYIVLTYILVAFGRYKVVCLHVEVEFSSSSGN